MREGNYFLRQGFLSPIVYRGGSSGAPTIIFCIACSTNLCVFPYVGEHAPFNGVIFDPDAPRREVGDIAFRRYASKPWNDSMVSFPVPNMGRMWPNPDGVPRVHDQRL